MRKGGLVRQGREINRSLWPDHGPYRQFLAFLDRVHEENGRKSLRSIASVMTVRSPTRISAMLRGVNGTLPADEAQLNELIRALGGGRDEQSRGQLLYRRARQLRGALADDDAKRPASVKTTVVPRQLPPSVAGFVGRDRELRALDNLANEAMNCAATVVISAVDGSPGIGKTALALHWGHQAADRFPDGQLYVNLRGFDAGGLTMTPGEAVRVLLDAFEVPADRIPVGEQAQAGLLRSIASGRRLLLVLDNARDSEQVRSLLPGSPGCLVIVTSRNRLGTLISAEGARPLTLDLLTVSESQKLLEHRVGAAKVAAEPQMAREIITLCARLPLALSIVSTRLATHPGFALAAVAAELRVAGTADADALALLNTGEADSDVAAAFAWSYQQLTSETARLFRLLGLHPGPAISIPAAASLAGASQARARESLTELARAHLIEERVLGRYSFHDLLRAYAIRLGRAQDSDESRQAALTRLLSHYVQSAFNAAMLLYPMVNPISIADPPPGTLPETFEDYAAAWAWFEADRAVLVSAVKLAADVPGRYGWQLPWALQDYFRRRGHWDDWAMTEQVALSVARREKDPYGQAQAHHGLGRAFTWLTDYDQAADHLNAAVRLFAHVGDVAAEANAYLDLAQMYSQAGQPDQALGPAREGLRLADTTDDRAAKAKALNNTGWYYAQLGQPTQALAHCEQALKLFRELGNRRGQSNTLDSIGYALHLLQEYSQAISYYEESLVFRQELGDRHGHAATLTHLGDTHYETANFEAAREAWSEALEIFDDLGHPDAGGVRTKLDQLPAPSAVQPES